MPSIHSSPEPHSWLLVDGFYCYNFIRTFFYFTVYILKLHQLYSLCQSFCLFYFCWVASLLISCKRASEHDYVIKLAALSPCLWIPPFKPPHCWHLLFVVPSKGHIFQVLHKSGNFGLYLRCCVILYHRESRFCYSTPRAFIVCLTSRYLLD